MHPERHPARRFGEIAPKHDETLDANGSAFQTTAQSENSYQRLWEEQLELNARKDKFLAVLSHELRNPLAPLLTAVNLLQQHRPKDPIQANAIQIIERQARQLAHLVDDLLDVSRFTSGKIVLRKEMIDLRAVVERAIEGARPLIDARQHDLSVSLPTDPLWLHADPARLEQAFLNLLNNAAKYTSDHGCIWLELTATGDRALLRVRDSGCGISPESLPIIFEFFAQVDSNPSCRQAGLGIGLALVKVFVELHGGTVTATSDGEGRGADFTVELPGLAHPQRNAHKRQATEAIHPLRVLVVDDNADAANTLKLLLELSGHQSQAVYTGVEAVEAAQSFRPDVILLDIGLPDLSGYDVAEWFRSQLETHDTIIVALTGFGSSSDRQQAEKSGCNYHLTKPVDLKRLQVLMTEASRMINSGMPQKTG